MPQLPYFPRPALLQKITTMFDAALMQGVCLFAPRREGKTWFVRHELTPSFQNRGWSTIYIDLWLNREHPEQAIITALEANSPPPRSISRRIKKLEIKVAGSGGTLEQFPDTQDNDLSPQGRLKAALDRLAKKHAPLLLVIDEVQTLANSKDANFVAALRATLQAHQGRIFAFYTGSSRNALNKMFKNRKAPLFDSAYTMQLDKLGHDFVQDRAAYYKKATGRSTDTTALGKVFEIIGHNPFYMNQIITKMIIEVINDPMAALQQWEQRDDGDGFKAQWATLKPLHRAILVETAQQRDEGIYTVAARERMSTQMGETDVVEASVVQQGIRTLSNKGLVDAIGEAGRYEMADRAFAHFIRSCESHHRSEHEGVHGCE